MGKIRIGVNGCGRMGRLSLRFLLSSDKVEIVHVNEPYSTPEGVAYLLEFDSIHGRYKDSFVADGNKISVADTSFTCSNFEKPNEVPWSTHNVDLVLECSGKFNNLEILQQQYLDMGVKRVLVSAPVKEALNVVVGCNDQLITPDTRVVTAASCTTNCISPVIKALDEAFGIDHGCITTIHNVTNTQTIMDAPNVKKDDLRRCRSGMTNLAPTSTGSAKAVTMIFPHLQGKLNGRAIRVPLQNASITDLVLELKREVTVEEVNAALQAESKKIPKILGYEERPLVSTDYVNDERSSIVDAQSTMVICGTQVKIYAWYDNEYGYAKRMADIAEIMAMQMM